VKKTINQHFSVKHLRFILNEMSWKDFLEMDRYIGQDGGEKHELLEIISELITLASPS
jgi:hypothetical protein